MPKAELHSTFVLFIDANHRDLRLYGLPFSLIAELNSMRYEPRETSCVE